MLPPPPICISHFHIFLTCGPGCLHTRAQTFIYPSHSTKYLWFSGVHRAFTWSRRLFEFPDTNILSHLQPTPFISSQTSSRGVPPNLHRLNHRPLFHPRISTSVTSHGEYHLEGGYQLRASQYPFSSKISLLGFAPCKIRIGNSIHAQPITSAAILHRSRVSILIPRA